MNKKFKEQVDRVIAMIKDKGKDKILLALHRDTEIPQEFEKLIEGMEITHSKFVPRGMLYFIDKKPYKYTLPDEFDEAEKFLKTPRGSKVMGWLLEGIKANPNNK